MCRRGDREAGSERTRTAALTAGPSLRAATDDLTAERVVVVNRSFVDTFSADASPIGTWLNIGYNQPDTEDGEPLLRRIVGVVDNVREFGLGASTPATYYLSRRQEASRSMTLIVHAAIRAEDAVPMIRSRLAEVDADLPLHQLATLSEVILGTTADRRFRLVVVAGFAVLALVLAALGIYGTVAFAVSMRTHEIGVRMAIGARPSDVHRLVLRNGLIPVLAGLVIGLLAALGAGRVLQSLLFEVGPRDPLTLAGVTVSLLAVAILACWIPARRAMHTNPVSALRGH